jgi:hypothetical protein
VKFDEKPQILDDAMPRWDRRSIHRISTALPPSVLLAAVEEVTWREVPVFKALLTLRGLGRRALRSHTTVLEWFMVNGFRQLGRTESELLVAAIQPVRRAVRPAPPSAAHSFRNWCEPGCIKIATSFATIDGFLVTETRVLATDARSRRYFAVYWLVIRTGSGVIRRVWLHAIESRARVMATACAAPPAVHPDSSAVAARTRERSW